ncbi:MAG: hypothetical protein DMF99_22835 [Acidobacteria bacterium]|nr:MAG: hypothetical protein DMF99_22835 [Acidobacteriota bacterium]
MVPQEAAGRPAGTEPEAGRRSGAHLCVRRLHGRADEGQHVERRRADVDGAETRAPVHLDRRRRRRRAAGVRHLEQRAAGSVHVDVPGIREERSEVGNGSSLPDVGQREAVDLRSEPLHGHDRAAALRDDAQPVSEGVRRDRLLRHGDDYGWRRIQLHAPRVRQAGHRPRVARLLRSRPHDLHPAVGAQGAEERRREVHPGDPRAGRVPHDLTAVISRRAFLRDLSAASVAMAAAVRADAGAAEGASESGLRVDARKLRSRIETLSTFGRPAGGSFAVEFSRTMQAASATAATEVQGAIERAARALNLQSMRLPSGAGHDAQMMALIGPMGMIFVPNVGGVSHSPKELTSWDDCARGADVLARTVLEMDNVHS